MGTHTLSTVLRFCPSLAGGGWVGLSAGGLGLGWEVRHGRRVCVCGSPC